MKVSKSLEPDEIRRLTHPVTPKIPGFRIVCSLGKGCFGHVYKAVRAIGHQEAVAIKAISRANIADPDAKVRLQREIDCLCILDHPGLVRLDSFRADSENFYVIMEYCKGGSLQGCLDRNGSLKEDSAALIILQLAKVLAYIHGRGVVHRDIKPENILVSRWPLIKLSDFGLCGFVTNELLTDPCGSPAFAAPECFARAPYDGLASDMWSLGVTLYALVTGVTPWNMRSYSAMIADIKAGKIASAEVSVDCKDLISSLLRVDPTQRLTAAEVLAHPFLEKANGQTFEKFGAKAFLSKGLTEKSGDQPKVCDVIKENRPLEGYDGPSVLPCLSKPSFTPIVSGKHRMINLPRLLWANGVA